VYYTRCTKISLVSIGTLLFLVFFVGSQNAFADHSPVTTADILIGGIVLQNTVWHHAADTMVMTNLSNDSHWLASRDGTIDSGLLGLNDSVSFQLIDIGVYEFFCIVHSNNTFEMFAVTVIGSNQPINVGGSLTFNDIFFQAWESMDTIAIDVQNGGLSNAVISFDTSSSVPFLIFETVMSGSGEVSVGFQKYFFDSSFPNPTTPPFYPTPFFVLVDNEEFLTMQNDKGNAWEIGFLNLSAGVHTVEIIGTDTDTIGSVAEYTGPSSFPSVNFDSQIYNLGDIIVITVVHSGFNLDNTVIDRTSVTITDSLGFSFDVDIAELGPSAGVFVGSTPVGGSAPQGQITVEYLFYDSYPPSLNMVIDFANISYGFADPISFTLDKSGYMAGSQLQATLHDPTYNTNPNQVETVRVFYQSPIHPSIEFQLTETDLNTYNPSTNSDYFLTDFTIPTDETGNFYIVLNHPNGQFSNSGYITYLGSSIDLNQKVYTWIDKVYITIVAPNFNVDSSKIDTIGDQSDNTVKIKTDTSNLILTRYKLVETGTDSGIFTGEFFLTGIAKADITGDGKVDGTGITSGNGPTDGRIGASNTDTLTVEFSTPFEQVIASADIRSNNGEIKFLDSSYKINQKPIIQLTDPDINLFLGLVDMISVQVWSDSDTKKVELGLTETGPSTGIFRGDLILSTISASGGDKIHAQYIDRSLYDMQSPTSTQTFIATASILETLTADTTPPAITVPASDLKVNTRSSLGAIVSFSSQVSANDDKDGKLNTSCFPGSDSIFPLGKTLVTCTAIDLALNKGTGTFYVIVEQKLTGSDTTPPAITVPASDLKVKATSSLGAIVSFSSQVSANDNRDGSVKVTCFPGSGTFFDVGKNPVNCSARDSSGNRATLSFNVIIEAKTTQISIPSWLKQSLGLWCPEYNAGKSDTGTFLNLITWLVQKGIIVLPPTQSGAQSSQAVPDWVTNTACWWADGRVSDTELADGLRWLIKEGILHV